MDRLALTERERYLLPITELLLTGLWRLTMKRIKSLLRVSVRFFLVLIVAVSVLMAHLAGHWHERRIEQEFVQRLNAELTRPVRIDRESQVDRYLCGNFF